MEFSFGKNWKKFSTNIKNNNIEESKNSLKEVFNLESLTGMSFLDIGSGSGLSSIAAAELGASPIRAFDYDNDSVEATNLNFKKYVKNKDVSFKVTKNSVLDIDFLKSLPKFDIYYSWGVLHHTGSLHNSYANLVNIIPSDSLLYIAIYNDQGMKSKLWWIIKYLYNKNFIYKSLIIFAGYWYFVFLKSIYNFLLNKKTRRGMNLYIDMKDWLGGFPFEVETESQTISFFKTFGFELIKSYPVGDKLG